LFDTRRLLEHCPYAPAFIAVIFSGFILVVHFVLIFSAWLTKEAKDYLCQH